MVRLSLVIGQGEISSNFLHLFTVKPELQNYNGIYLTRQENEQAIFNCSADGIPAPDIVWRRNGQLLFNIEDKFIISNTMSETFRSKDELPGLVGTKSVLTVRSLTTADSAEYSCRADNGAGLGVFMEEPYRLEVVNGTCA